MEELTGQLDSLTNMMGQITSVMEISEGRRRETGRRIRSAIDELANDASLKRQVLVTLSSKLEDARSRTDTLDGDIASAIDKLASHHGKTGALDDATLDYCVSLGELAARRQKRETRHQQLETEVQDVQHQIDDIEFQIGELKKRVEDVYAETDQHLTEQQRNLESLEIERAAVEKKLCDLSSQLGTG
jgi:chromosome segregation ATPase